MPERRKFFIGDTHFGHVNLIHFETGRRQFATIEEHDRFLVNAWNETVRPEDIVYHLGDVFFGQPPIGILSALHGTKYLILGNHDKPQHMAIYCQHFAKVHGVAYLDGGGVLTHVPMHPSQLEFRWKFNVHGHIHRGGVNDRRYVNVCCEAINYRPLSLEEIRRRVDRERANA